jgi:uncharacterized protein YbjT (DUF2867 family)
MLIFGGGGFLGRHLCARLLLAYRAVVCIARNVERHPTLVKQEEWFAAGFVDTMIGCFMKPEVADGKTTVWA